MNKIKIGIDLDDTVWKFHEGFFNFYNEKYNTNYSVDKYHEYCMEDFLGISEDEVHSLFDEFGYSSDEMILLEGFLDFLKKFEERFEFIFITARNKGLEDLTKRKIMKNIGQDYPVIFCYDENRKKIKEKVDFCKELGISIMIDDALHNLEKCVEEGIQCFLLNYAWNKNKEAHKEIIRVNDWYEIMEKIKND